MFTVSSDRHPSMSSLDITLHLPLLPLPSSPFLSFLFPLVPPPSFNFLPLSLPVETKYTKHRVVSVQITTSVSPLHTCSVKSRSMRPSVNSDLSRLVAVTPIHLIFVSIHSSSPSFPSTTIMLSSVTSKVRRDVTASATTTSTTNQAHPTQLPDLVFMFRNQAYEYGIEGRDECRKIVACAPPSFTAYAAHLTKLLRRGIEPTRPSLGRTS